MYACMPFVINKTGREIILFPISLPLRLRDGSCERPYPIHSCSWKRYWNLSRRIWSFSPIYIQFHFKSREFMSFIWNVLHVSFSLLEINCWIRRSTAKVFDSARLDHARLFRAKEVGRKALLFSFWMDVLRRTVLPNRPRPVYHAKAKLNLLETQ